MKKWFIIILMGLLFTSCNKVKEVYTPEINQSINTQSVAMTIIYDLIHMHHVTAKGYTFYTDYCYNRTADTLGSTILDTMHLNIQSYCHLMESNVTSGSYTSKYHIPFPSIIDTVKINVDFTSNGVRLKGKIKYFYQTLTLITIAIENMELTDTHGASSNLNASLFMYINASATDFYGSMDFNGAHNFTWETDGALSGPNDFDFSDSDYIHEFYLRSGTAHFDFGTTKIIENFGNGEDDNLATVTDNTGQRIILILPRL